MSTKKTLQKLWFLLIILSLMSLTAAPVAADPPPDTEDTEETEESGELFDHFGFNNVDPVFLPQYEEMTSFSSRPMSLMSSMQADLPSYWEEALAEFDAPNAVEIVRYMAEQIGPRLSGTPQEMEAAQYLGSLLESYGYQVTIETYPQTTTRNVGTISSPLEVLPGRHRYQMSSSTSAKITGDADPVIAEVVYAGTGLTLASFPPDTAGKIVMMNYSSAASTRNTAVVNAVSLGAVGVILVQTGANSAPPNPFALTTPQPDIPVLGGGRAHMDWINGRLAQGPLTLQITTNRYINMPLVNVVGVRRAVGDPDGTSAPIIYVGGHIDSVLGAPGANDNASGSSAAVEIARVLGQYALDKEIRIGGWGAEESGLVGATRHVATLNAATRARVVGYWNMDMVASPHAPLRLWALTSNGQTNHVVQAAQAAAARIDYAPFDFCRLGSSDHVPFHNAGIPAALFIWINYTKPANCATTTGSYSLETIYHRPQDNMDNIGLQRMNVALSIIGGSSFYSALNSVSLTAADYQGAPFEGAAVRADCGEGWRSLGSTNSAGVLNTVIPHATCDFQATTAGGASLVRISDVEVHGDRALAFPAPPALAPSLPAPVLLNGTAYPHVTYSAFPIFESSCVLDTSSVGAKVGSCTATDEGGNTTTASVAYQVVYGFSGFTDPVVNLPVFNIANSGQSIPLKWRLTDAFGAPVTTLSTASVIATNLACQLGSSGDQIEEYAPGSSGLQNLGDGYYQYNWATPKGYARSCKTMNLSLGEGPGIDHSALFKFTK